MAASHVGGTTWAGFGSQNFTLPTADEGDVAIVGATYNPGVGIPTLPAGWTLLRTHTFSSTMESRYWTRTLTAGDSAATVTITYSGSVKNSGALVVYRDALLPPVAHNSSDNATVANLTTDRATVRIIGITERGGTPSTNYTPPAGFTERVEVHQTGGGSTGFGWADKLTEEAAGTVGGESWTNDGSPGGIATFSIALEPVAAAPLPDLLLTHPVRAVEYAAHRGGDPGPEETDHAFTASWNDSDSAAEGDMQLNASGTVVLMHDDTIDRTASPSSPTTTGNVSAMSDAQWAAHLCEANAGLTAPDSPPSTLASLAALHGPGGSLGARLLVMENKVGTDATTTVAAIKALGLEDRLIFNGYTYADVTYARSQGLAAMYQASNGEVTAGLDFAGIKADGIDWLACDKSVVDAAFCTSAHNAGLDVWVYLVNSTGERDTYLGYGVDGIFTNKPQTLDPPTTASGGASSTVTASALGAGSSTESASSGAGSTVTVSATGAGAASEFASGGAASGTTVAPTGGGAATEHASGGATASTLVTSSGGGGSSQEQHTSGGSAASVAVTASGSGQAADVVAGGASAAVNVTTTGSGTATEAASSGAAVFVGTVAGGDGAGLEAAAGGALATLLILAVGSGHDPAGFRDVTATAALAPRTWTADLDARTSTATLDRRAWEATT